MKDRVHTCKVNVYSDLLEDGFTVRTLTVQLSRPQTVRNGEGNSTNTEETPTIFTIQ
jgi:hypothetical protein